MGRTPKILIVEDNTFNHDLYRDAFEGVGFEVSIVEGADAHFVEYVATQKPDIISMDVMIQEREAGSAPDGFAALARLKLDERTRDIPVMMLTSFFEESKVARAKELGAVDFITLPGQSMTKIAEHFLAYLKHPKHYQPSHLAFKGS